MSAESAGKNTKLLERMLLMDATRASEDQSNISVPKYVKNRHELQEHLKFIRRNKRLIKRGSVEKMLAARRLQGDREPGSPYKLFPHIRQSPEIRAIIKYFIDPLTAVLNQHQELSIMDRLSIIFNEKTRDIVMAVFVNDIKMRGLVWDPEDGTTRVPLTSEAHFPRGTPVFVRIDDHEELPIQIENAEKPGLIFNLTKMQYSVIVSELREIDGCNYKLNPPGEDGPFTPLISKRNVIKAV